MEPYIEQRLIQLLRESPAPSVPLRRVHDTLLAEGGPGVGSLARLVEEIGRRSDIFAVLAVDNPLGEDSGWPPGTRSEYEAELAASGFETGPYVTLVHPGHARLDPGSRDDGCERFAGAAQPIRQLHDSLMQIWTVARPDSALRRAVAGALASCRELPDVLHERSA